MYIGWAKQQSNYDLSNRVCGELCWSLFCHIKMTKFFKNFGDKKAKNPLAPAQAEVNAAVVAKADHFKC